MLTTLRRFSNSLVLLIPLSLLAVGAVRRVQGVFAFLNTDARLAGTLSAEATRLLGREVRVGDVEISGNLWSLTSKNTVRLKNVTLEDDGKRGKSLITIDEVVVTYNLNQILRPARPSLPLIDSLHLQKPSAIISRDAQGRFNFDLLLKKLLETQSSGGRVFTHRATLANGSILYTDAALPTPPGVQRRAFSTLIDNLGGIVNIRPDSSVAFDITGQGVQETLQNFHIIGAYFGKPMQIVASVEAQGVQLTTLGERVLPAKEGQLKTGRAEVALSAVYSPTGAKPFTQFEPNALSLEGNVRLSNLSGTVRNLREPVQIPFVNVTVNDTSLQADLQLMTAGNKVQLFAQTLNLKLADLLDARKFRTLKPKFVASGSLSAPDLKRLTNDISGFDLSRLTPEAKRQIAGIKGGIITQFTAQGDAQNPILSLRASTETLSAPAGKLDTLRLNADYRDKTLLASVSAKTLKGELRAQGLYTGNANRPYLVKAQLRNIEVGSLPTALLKSLPKNINLSGLSGKIELDAQAQGNQAQAPRGTARVLVKNLALAGDSIRSIYASVESNSQTAIVKNLRVEDDLGYLVANGQIGLKDRSLDLNVAANEIDIADVLDTAGKLAPRFAPKLKLALDKIVADGVIYLRGQDRVATKITGTFDDPKVQGKLTAFDLTAGRLDVDKADVTFDLDKNRLIIAGANVVRAPGYVSLSGVVTDPFSATPEVSATATVDSLDLNDLLFEANIPTNNLRITGTVSTDKPLLITGTPQNLRLREPANFVLEKATVNDVPIKAASALAEFKNSTLTLLDANADLLNGHFHAAGNVSVRGDLDLSASLQNFDLGELDALLPESAALLFGKIRAELRVTGTTKSPIASVQVQGDNLRYSTYVLGNVTGGASLRNGLASVDHLKIEEATLPNAPKRTIELTDLNYDLDTGEIEGQGRVEGVTQDRVHALIQAVLDSDAANSEFRDQMKTLTGQLEPFVAIGSPIFPLYFAASESARDPLQILRTILTITDSVRTDLAGNFTINGTKDDPSVKLDWSDIPIQVAGFDLTLKKNTASLTKAFFDAPELEIATQEGDLIAKGTHVEFGGAIRSDIDGYNLTLAPLSSFLKRPTNPSALTSTGAEGDYLLAGTATLGLQIRGKTASPEIQQASVNLADVVLSRKIAPDSGTVGPVADSETLLKINRADLNDITLKNGVINSDDLRVTINNTVIKGTANVSQFSWVPPFLPVTAPITVSADLLPKSADDKNLQELATLFPGFLGRQSEGTLTVRTKVDGTLGELQTDPLSAVSTSVELAASRLQFASGSNVTREVSVTSPVTPTKKTTFEKDIFATGLKDVDARVDFSGDLLTMTRFTATTRTFDTNSGANPSVPNVLISGSLPLDDAAKARHPEATGIEIVVNKAYVDEKKLPVLGAGTLSAVAQANLFVRNTLEQPALSGDASVTNTRISLPSTFGVATSKATKHSFNPTFNRLRLTLGKNVRVTNALLDTQVSGEATLNGSLDDPRLSGNLALNGGKLTITTTRLTIRQPSTLTVTYPIYSQGEPTLGLNINLRAEGTIPIKSAFGGTTRDRVSIQVIGPLTGEVVDPTTNQSRLRILSNDPRIDQATLFRTLALGDPDALDALGKNPGSVLAERLTNVFTGAVLPRLFDNAAQSLGFDDLALGYDPVQNFNFNLSRRLFGPFFVSYQRSLSSVRDQYTFRLSIRFNERFQTSYEINETNEQRFLLEGVFRFP